MLGDGFALVRTVGFEQLVVYFSKHPVNVEGVEHNEHSSSCGTVLSKSMIDRFLRYYIQYFESLRCFFVFFPSIVAGSRASATEYSSLLHGLVNRWQERK